jgi:hypothetical protein
MAVLCVAYARAQNRAAKDREEDRKDIQSDKRDIKA